MADLDRICSQIDLSMADVHVLGAIRAAGNSLIRATDLARSLHVSNAVLSTRVAKLMRKGLLTRMPDTSDRRAAGLRLLPAGVSALDTAISHVERRAQFVTAFRRLTPEDQRDLARIMGDLHNRLDREFISPARGGG